MTHPNTTEQQKQDDGGPAWYRALAKRDRQTWSAFAIEQKRRREEGGK